ncbi:TetR/AcrR family transcriptional regulator [Mycobacterium sp. PDNC021]|uniref:TetR/AcrR family transcriptional regulator n=1 Tax=Mycobacterium sp. PDNC021 TaxID=3391399 RepID=UPI003AAEC153
MSRSGSIVKNVVAGQADRQTRKRVSSGGFDGRQGVPTLAQDGNRRIGRPSGSSAVVTRDRIIDAAQTVFCDWGFDAATMDAIAELSGVTRPALRYYFDSKDALYAAVLEVVRDECFAAAVNAVGSYPDLAGRLVAFMTELFVDGQNDSARASLFMKMAVQACRQWQPLGGLSDPFDEVRRFVSDCVAAASANGEFDADVDVGVVAEAALTLVSGVAIYSGIPGSGAAVADVIDYVGSLFSPA